MSKPIDHVILDLEILKGPDALPGKWDDTHLMGVSVAAVKNVATGRFDLYEGDEKGIKALKERLLAADRITGFNLWKFDLPVIWGLKQPERVDDLREETDDLLRRIWLARELDPNAWTKDHGPWSLGRCCVGSFDEDKIGNGADAPKWWAAGQKTKVIEYCIDDVRLTLKLWAHIEKGLGVSTYGGMAKVPVRPWSVADLEK